MTEKGLHVEDTLLRYPCRVDEEGICEEKEIKCNFRHGYCESEHFPSPKGAKYFQYCYMDYHFLWYGYRVCEQKCGVRRERSPWLEKTTGPFCT